MAFDIDQWKNRELTEAINLVPYIPGRIGQMGLFRKRPVFRTSIEIEYKNNMISLISTKPRGSQQGERIPDPSRVTRVLNIPHIPQFKTITAEDLPDIRAFGTRDGRITFMQAQKDALIDMRQNLEATIEYHRMGAIGGKILEPNGSTIHDLFSTFGIAQPTATINFATDDVKAKVTAIERSIETSLGATPMSGLHFMCGDSFFDWLIAKPEVKTAYERWRDGQFLRDGSPRKGFEYAGATWENYRGKVGTVTFVPTTKARVIPTGVPNLFEHVLGPADTMDAVGNLGKEVVITRKVLDHDTGVELKYQTNPLIFCKRPSVLVEVTGSYSA